MPSLFQTLFPAQPHAPESVTSLAPTGEVANWVLENSSDYHRIELGVPASFERATVCYRRSPFWMHSLSGGPGLVLPVETQFLILRLAADRFAIVVPLIDGPFRCSLEGGEEGAITLVAETGDSGAEGTTVRGLYLAEGDDPYRLAANGAEAVAGLLKRGRLRKAKGLPAFADLFGWCTWDAFYKEVSADKVREGLESFRQGGVQPKYLVLDDGWQEYAMFPTGEGRLTGLNPNEKFEGDLSSTVQMAKGEFGIEQFLVWHAFTGYWGGLDAESLPGYRVHRMRRRLSPSMEKVAAWLNEPWGAHVGLIDGDDVSRFYHDYHRRLRAQGVDGVKVDVQTQVETLAEGQGGRVRLMQRYREALEGAVQVHFGGNLINCMSLSNEMIYQTNASSLTRSSDDFYPNKPKSHGKHLHANAQVGFWFGHFIHPDWDMFQSSHPMGAFHAAGRAVSGGPVYVSDKPDAHDFTLLRKLVLANGRVPRARGVGVPTRDSLFHDPVTEPVALKVFNHNATNGVLGIFNCRFIEETEEMPGVEAEFGPADVEGLSGEEFAVFSHGDGRLRVMTREQREKLALNGHGYEVATVAPVVEGVALIGDPGLFNSGGIVEKLTRTGRRWEITLKAPGELLLLAEREPTALEGAGVKAFDADNLRLLLECPGQSLVVEW